MCTLSLIFAPILNALSHPHHHTTLINRIDGEMQRLNQKHEAEAEFLMKQQQWSKLEPKLPANFDFEDEINIVKNGHSDKGPVAGFTSGVNRNISNPRRRKDERMAANDPMRYCADRCVTTGNCDVFEVS